MCTLFAVVLLPRLIKRLRYPSSTYMSVLALVICLTLLCICNAIKNSCKQRSLSAQLTHIIIIFLHKISISGQVRNSSNLLPAHWWRSESPINSPTLNKRTDPPPCHHYVALTNFNNATVVCWEIILQGGNFLSSSNTQAPP